MEHAPDVLPEQDALLVDSEPAADLTSASIAKPPSDAASQARPSSAGASGSRSTKPRRNREESRVSNAKRQGRVKEMMNGLARTREHVEQLEESVRALEAENHDLRTLLSK